MLTSGGERWPTAGYSAPRTSAAELWRLLRALEDERLARMPGAVSTLPASPPPPPAPRQTHAARFLASIGVILLIAAGTLPLHFGVTGIGPALRAASGGGTAGYYIPQRETTGQGAQWYGEFRLPDGTVTRRDTGREDVSRGALRTGVPVAARDTGYFDGVFPRADPGAWHAPADMFTGGAFFYTAALDSIIRLGILRLRRDSNDDDGNVPASPQAAGHLDLPVQHPGRGHAAGSGCPNRVKVPDHHCRPRPHPASLHRLRTARPRRVPGRVPRPHPRGLHAWTCASSPAGAAPGPWLCSRSAAPASKALPASWKPGDELAPPSPADCPLSL